MSGLRIELFGPLRIRAGSASIHTVNTNRLRSLLAYLVLHPEAAQPREYLAFLLWPESEESQARTNLRQLLHHLRRALPEPELIVAEGPTVQWRRARDCQVDVWEFTDAMARAGEAQRRSDTGAERSALEQAVALYQGDLLPELYDEWARTKRDELRQQAKQALGRLAAIEEERGEYPEAIGHAERLLALDGLQETAYQQLIRLHAGSHDRAAAVRVYNQCQKALRKELGMPPGPETRRLFDRLLKAEEPGRAKGRRTAAASLVGRSGEWSRLLEWWRRCKSGRALFGLIEGEAGAGKSRLAEELFQHAVSEGAGAARARCYAAHGYLSYAPVTDLLRAEPLRGAVRELAPPQKTEVARIVPELLVEDPEIAAPRPLAESWQRRHFFEALTAILRKAPKPLLLWIDDMQWCDRETVEWLHHYFRSDAPAQVLVLGTARPEEVGREHALARLMRELGQSGEAEKLEAGPLDEEATRLLAGQTAQRELEQEYLGRLHSETKGNALFVVESVRARLENRESRTVPATGVVRAVITARLANLSAEGRSLAELAAVLGRPFGLRLLAAASEMEESSLASALEELWLRRIVHGHGAQEYDFTHDVLREVTYAELTPVRRAVLHAKAARALETAGGADWENQSGQIAAHYEQAGMPEQAIPHLHRAARLAQRMYADADAAELMERALALCRRLTPGRSRDRMELELLATLEHAQFTTLGYAAAEVGETNARAFELVKQLGDRRHLLNVLGGGWLFHIVRGKLEMARDRSKQFLEAAAEEGASVQSAGHFIHGAVLFHLGDLREAREHLERAVAIYPEGGEPPLPMFFGPNVAVFARSYVSHIQWYCGLGDRALRTSEEAVALARKPAHPFSLAIASTYAALLNLFLGRPEIADRSAEEAVAVSRAHGFPYYLGCASIIRAAARAKLGRDGEHVARLRREVEQFQASGAEVRLPLYHGLAAEACLRQGLREEAAAHVAAASTYEAQNGETWWKAELLCIRGDLLGAEGKDPMACYRSALEWAQRQGAKAGELRAAVRVARTLMERGEEGEARAVLEPVHALWREGLHVEDYQEASRLLDGRGRRVRAGGA